MPVIPNDILDKLADADQAGINMKSPKAVVNHLLAQGEKESILFFYKRNSLEFDFDKFNGAVEEMQKRKK
ncbi:hypothetical protein QWY16_11815 [Planococcus shenhongbingii]|uniref:hypothetical protein n=1 Tax=Planococcus shenhongbingii TaxID=3058398 RepID=UPI0026192087|nr:hypothetical protein [Planococcus sp. N016]WKA57188.1 hypothetical protein QWY16_11815 [Planococcus sp. N016]